MKNLFYSQNAFETNCVRNLINIAFANGNPSKIEKDFIAQVAIKRAVGSDDVKKIMMNHHKRKVYKSKKKNEMKVHLDEIWNLLNADTGRSNQRVKIANSIAEEFGFGKNYFDKNESAPYQPLESKYIHPLILGALPEIGVKAIDKAIEYLLLTATDLIQETNQHQKPDVDIIKKVYLEIAEYLNKNYKYGTNGFYDIGNGEFGCYASSIIIHSIFCNLFPSVEDNLKFVLLRQHLSFGIFINNKFMYLDSVAFYNDFKAHLKDFPENITGNEFTEEFYIKYFKIGRNEIENDIMLRKLTLEELTHVIQLSIAEQNKDFKGVLALEPHLQFFPKTYKLLTVLAISFGLDINPAEVNNWIEKAIELDPLDFFPYFLKYVITRHPYQFQLLVSNLPDFEKGELPLGLSPVFTYFKEQGGSESKVIQEYQKRLQE